TRSARSTPPLGRPKWVTTTTRAPRSRSASMVGSAARMRRSSTMRPPSVGTLKSTRSSTLLPPTWMSSMPCLATVTGVLTASVAADSQPCRHVVRQIDHPAGVAPLVVVPGEHLDDALADAHGRGKVDDRGVAVVEEVGRNQLLVGDREDALHGPLRR